MSFGSDRAVRMGNCSDFETVFIQQTLAFIDQFNEMIEVEDKPFREQYS